MKSTIVGLLMLTITALVLQAGQVLAYPVPAPRDNGQEEHLYRRGGRSFHREFVLENGTPSSPRGDRATREAVKGRQRWHQLKNFDIKSAVTDAVTRFPYKSNLAKAAKTTGHCLSQCMQATIDQPNTRTKHAGYRRIPIHG